MKEDRQIAGPPFASYGYRTLQQHWPLIRVVSYLAARIFTSHDPRSMDESAVIDSPEKSSVPAGMGEGNVTASNDQLLTNQSFSPSELVAVLTRTDGGISSMGGLIPTSF